MGVGVGDGGLAYQGPTEVSRCFVPGAAGRCVPADVDVVHESVTVEKTLP